MENKFSKIENFHNNLMRILTGISITILLASCVNLQKQDSSLTIEKTNASETNTIATEWGNPIKEKNNTKHTDAIKKQAALVNNTNLQGRQRIIEIGNQKFINTRAATQKKFKPNEEGEITLNFQETNLEEFVKVILSDVLNLNYIIDPNVTGTVSMNTATPIKKSRLFSLLEEVLSINNAAIIKSDEYYKIVSKTDATKSGLAPSISSSKQGYSVRIVPLQYIAAQEMQKILEPFIPDAAYVRIDKQRNMVILGGTPSDLSTMQETIDIFDVDWLRGMSVGLYPLDYVDPKTLKTEIDTILSQVEGGTENDLLGGIVKTVSIERLNSLLLISSTPAGLREAEIWLYRLDRPGEQIGQRLYVYDVQNAKATEIADILSQIFNGTNSNVSSQTPTVELAPGNETIELSSTNSRDGVELQIDPNLNSSNGNNLGRGITIRTDSDLQIIADDTRNALVILATPQDYKMVAAAIRKLDIVPLQVLIEASILEVSLNDDLSYGVEWFFKNGLGDKSGQGTLDLGAAGISALSPSFSYSIVDSASNIRVAINALASESEVNVLSSPSLMVLDNQTASINVGDEIPVPTRQSISNIDPNAPTVNEIQFRNTGITLEVTPRVNNSGLVTMDIRQEVSNAVDTTSSSIDAPTIQQRQIESTVAINSGETIVLGGLMTNTETNNESGIPGLYQLPVIGKLFGQTSRDGRRTELMILLTPKVVRNSNDARDVTEELRRKLQSIPSLDKLSRSKS